MSDELSPEARASLEAGLESARREAPVYLGSFAQSDRALRDALERARVVGVLDAWIGNPMHMTHTPPVAMPGPHGIDWVVFVRGRMFVGQDADAARAAAAKAIEAGEG